MPKELLRYLQTCNPDVAAKICNYLDSFPTAVSEIIEVLTERIKPNPLSVDSPFPGPSYNQHPKYEQWKNICPKCNGQHCRHYSGSREFEVKLQCTDCNHIFTLKEAFEAQLKLQTEKEKK